MMGLAAYTARMSAQKASSRSAALDPVSAPALGDAEAPAAGRPAQDGTARVLLRQGRARPLWYGHPWVYGNAVLRLDGVAEPGDVVSVTDHDGKFIGRGFWNPRSQIPVRLCTRRDEPVDAAFLRARIAAARARRARLGLPSDKTTAYRLINSEGDDLPGLVVDAFGGAISVQVTTLGMAARREVLFEALAAELRPEAVYEVAAASYAEVEGFIAQAREVKGAGATRVACREDGIALEVEPLSGQKTGMFVDQRPSRMRVGQLARGARVLDCYSYAGGFALQAARGGATDVTAVDSSARAIARIEAHAASNGVSVRAVEADSFRFLETATPRSYDLVVIDPPKFARARKDLEAARKGYERLNALALTACAPGAILVTCSCSQNVSAGDFERIVAAGAKQSGRTVRILEQTGPGPDHPLPPGFSEGQYLKVFFVQVD
jgi:23S rRNA (cytosine1962-C5)-methyltransferase